MRAIISDALYAYLQHQGSSVLTITLDPLRCWSGIFFDVSVDTHAPRDSSRYDSFEQDGLRIYYSPKLARRSDVLELDFARVLFRGRPALVGPEELLAQVVMGRM